MKRLEAQQPRESSGGRAAFITHLTRTSRLSNALRPERLATMRVPLGGLVNAAMKNAMLASASFD
jgi:hypothetical protein